VPTGNLYRTSVRDSWRWIWWDVPARLLPLALVPLGIAWWTHTPLSSLGINLAHPGRDLVLAIPLGVIGFAIAAWFGEFLSRRNRRWFVPDEKDLAFQSFYYVALNAPIEELFFRGLLQWALIRWWQSALLGYLAVVIIFGAYHLLGRWGWRPVLGATFAGSWLGLIYLWQPAPASLLLPVIVHAAVTCGFLSLGPYAIFKWRVKRGHIKMQVEAPGAVL
jgi:membrane protease YdiL (CAAX protease family)